MRTIAQKRGHGCVSDQARNAPGGSFSARRSISFASSSVTGSGCSIAQRVLDSVRAPEGVRGLSCHGASSSRRRRIRWIVVACQRPPRLVCRPSASSVVMISLMARPWRRSSRPRRMVTPSSTTSSQHRRPLASSASLRRQPSGSAPRRTPSARSCARASRVRSAVASRSHWPTAPSTWSTRRPDAVRVSMESETERSEKREAK